MRYPSATRQNMRYRGPMESRKVNQGRQQARIDVASLYTQLDAIKSGTTTFMNDMRDGNETGITGGNEMSSQLMLIRKETGYLKGGGIRG
ncbi:hypothetical protein D3C87_1557260 [compost metagenome]